MEGPELFRSFQDNGWEKRSNIRCPTGRCGTGSILQAPRITEGNVIRCRCALDWFASIESGASIRRGTDSCLQKTSWEQPVKLRFDRIRQTGGPVYATLDVPPKHAS